MHALKDFEQVIEVKRYVLHSHALFQFLHSRVCLCFCKEIYMTSVVILVSEI